MSLPRDLPKFIKMKSSKPRTLFPRASLMVAAALLAVAAPDTARAANYTWNNVNSGTFDWNKSANWTSAGSGFPDLIRVTSPLGSTPGDVANLTNNIEGDNLILLNANISLDQLNIGDPVGGSQFLIQAGTIAHPGLFPLFFTSGAGQPNPGLAAGSLVFGSAASTSPVAIVKTGIGAADEINALVYFNSALTITSTAQAGKLTFSGGLRSGLSSITFTGAGTTLIRAVTLTTGGDLIKDGSGTLEVNIGLAHAGATLINAGLLRATAGNILPTRAAVTVAAGAAYDVNNTSQVIGSLSGFGQIRNSSTSAQSFQIGRNDTSSIFSGTFAGAASDSGLGSMGIIKLGAGNLTLNSANASIITGNLQLRGGSFVLDYANVAPPVNLTGATTTASSRSLTVDSTASLALGRLVTGGSLPAGAYVTRITSSTVFEVSAAPTTSATGLTLVSSQPHLLGMPSSAQPGQLTLNGGNFLLQGKVGLDIKQFFGQVNLNAQGGAITVQGVAAPNTTELVLGNLVFGTAAEARGILLVAAPDSAAITTSSALGSGGIYGAGRAVFNNTTSGNSYNWLTSKSLATPFRLVGLSDAPAVSVGGGTTVGTTVLTVPAAITLAGGATTSGSTTVTVTSNAGLAVGMAVRGPGIPEGASIASIPVGGTSFVLTTAATAAGTGVSLSAGGTTGFFPGMNITGTNMPAGAIVTAVTGTTLTISAAASGSTAGSATFTAQGYLPLPLSGGVATVNYLLPANQTLSGATTLGTLKIPTVTTTNATLGLAGFDLTFGAAGGGILVTGTSPFAIGANLTDLGGIKAGATGGPVFIHHYGTGVLSINAPVKNVAPTINTDLVIAGTGVTRLLGSMSYLGTTAVLQSATLEFTNVGATGAGTLGLGIAAPVVIADGATLRFANTTAGTYTLAGATSANSHVFTLPGGNARIDVPTASVIFVTSGAFSGAGGLTKTGAGTLQFAGAANFEGPLIISAGKVLIPAADRIGNTVPVTIASGAILEMAENDTFGSLSGAGTLSITGTTGRTVGLGEINTNSTFSGALTGAGVGHAFAKRGSGVITMDMPAVSNWAGGNTFIDGGVIRIATGRGQQFNPTANLVVNHDSRSGVFDLNGSQQSIAALTFFNTPNSNINSQAFVLLGSEGRLTLGGNITVNAHIGTGTQTAGIIGTGNGATLVLGEAQRTFTVNKSLNLAPGEAELVVDARVVGGVLGGILKNGGGTLRLMGSFEMGGSVANRFEAGLTILDYTKAFTSAFDTNRLNPLGLLELRGGAVRLFGHPTSPISQSVAGLILPSDSNSLVQVDSGLGTQNIVLNLGPISQRLGGTLRFVLPAGTQSAVNGITTTTRNDLFTGLVGTLSAAATVTDGAGVTSFATRVGTNIVPVSAISRDAVTGILNGEHITDVSGFTGTTLNVSAPITVRFAAAGTSVLSLPDGGILKVISGGILRTADAGVASVAVSGVSTTAGSASVNHGQHRRAARGHAGFRPRHPRGYPYRRGRRCDESSPQQCGHGHRRVHFPECRRYHGHPRRHLELTHA